MSLKNKFNQADKILDRKQKELEKQLIKEYAKSLKEIRAKMAEAYAKFGIDDKLTYAEMQKYNRLASLEKQILKELSNLSKTNAKVLREALKDVYKEGYFRVGYALETEGQIKLAYALLNAKQIEKAITNPLMELALENNAIDIKKRIRSDVIQGLTQGESYYKISKRIKKSLETNTNNAVRIAQTETHRVVNQARQDSYEHAESKGLKMLKVWVASLDGRTRSSHQELDGQKVGVKEDFISPVTGAQGQGPGMMGTAKDDINCRCTTIVEFEGFETEQAFRRSRGINNKNKVITYEKYTDWYKNRVKR